MEEALLCDGSVGEEPAIAQWLQQNNTSPSTNLTLDHNKFLRLEPFKTTVEKFLHQNGVLRPLIETVLQQAIRDAQAPDVKARVRVRHLQTHIASAISDVERLQVLIAEAEALESQLLSQIEFQKLVCIRKLQACARDFFARREAARRRTMEENNAHRVACTIKLQALIRGSLVRRQACNVNSQ